MMTFSNKYRIHYIIIIFNDFSRTHTHTRARARTHTHIYIYIYIYILTYFNISIFSQTTEMFLLLRDHYEERRASLCDCKAKMATQRAANRRIIAFLIVKTMVTAKTQLENARNQSPKMERFLRLSN